MPRQGSYLLNRTARPASIKWGKLLFWLCLFVCLLTYSILQKTEVGYRTKKAVKSMLGINTKKCPSTPEPPGVPEWVIRVGFNKTTWEKEQVERLRHVRHTCKKLNIKQTVDDDVMQHILVDNVHKSLLCYVPKVACTSWKRMWLWLTGKMETDEDVALLPRSVVHGPLLNSLNNIKYTEEQRQDMLKNYRKILFVRNPLDRLVSAYRDKLEHQDAESVFDFHRFVGEEIEKKMRGKVTSGGHNITFAEFSMWLTSSDGLHLTDAQNNEHWRPIIDLCAPCAIQYDIIGRYESLNEEVDYVLNLMGATKFIGKFPKSDRPFHARKVLRSYLSTLSTRLKLRLMSSYLADFLLFGYELL